MLNELLDRLKQGDLTIAVVDLSDLQPKTDSDDPCVQASKLMDWIIDNEKIAQRMYNMLESHGQPERAQQLKDWWALLMEPLNELQSEIPDAAGSREKDMALVQRIRDTAQPIVDCASGVLKAIVERHINAMAEVDIDDLIS